MKVGDRLVFFGNVRGLSGIEKECERAKDILRDIEGGYETAVMRALNRSVQRANTRVVQAVKSDYTAKQKYISRTMRTNLATTKHLEAMIFIHGERLPMRAFTFKPKTDTTGNKRKPVKVSVLKKGGMKTLGQSFVWNGLVLRRRGKSSFPVDTVYGPSVPSMAGNVAVTAEIENSLREAFQKNLDHEIDWILKSADKKE